MLTRDVALIVLVHATTIINGSKLPYLHTVPDTSPISKQKAFHIHTEVDQEHIIVSNHHYIFLVSLVYLLFIWNKVKLNKTFHTNVNDNKISLDGF